MCAAAILFATDDVQATTIASALPWLEIIRCRNAEAGQELCTGYKVCLALIVTDHPDDEGYQFFARLCTLQPGVAGVLFTSTVDFDLVRGALEAGFSGLVKLPINTAQAEQVVRQALERHHLQQENIRLRTLLPLYRLGEQFAAASSENEILEHLLDAVSVQTGASRISVMLFQPNEGYLRIAASRGMESALVEAIQQLPGEQIAGWVFQQGKPVILNKEDQTASLFAPLLQQPDVVSAISYPLKIRDRNIGVLNISQKETDDRFSEADNEMLAILCSQTAVAIENLRGSMQLAATTRLRTLFEQYVAPEVAELLLKEPANLTEVGDIKQVTILFADIRNFTRLVQHVDLQPLRQFLNEFFQFFTEEVFRYQGTIDKFMGDAVLAVFGAPVQLEAPSLAAAHAALAIKERFTVFRDQWISRSPAFQPVDLGIAITSGTVFFGNIGSARRLDYTVIGNEVNIAQRLAAKAWASRVYVTESVLREIGDYFAVEDVGEIALRGVEKKVQTFSLIGKKTENTMP
ncbi:adenylate/guanylate cyclase domain-containing protein [Desulfobulbus oligotrophicus]|uniref:GAF domain-containing protein n=1 Tax=Desulfobulbus oligotrophicus TaxID=1909699 RepID=A0A7T5VC99_9BACT|nr:adenylate/guanylate cyclase domain-containing protein [Desulfobulbus oligotrophicus]QQG65154.1 GAF domain-containing protein [Desulfobulbus oligotrophicus]